MLTSPYYVFLLLFLLCFTNGHDIRRWKLFPMEIESPETEAESPPYHIVTDLEPDRIGDFLTHMPPEPTINNLGNVRLTPLSDEIGSGLIGWGKFTSGSSDPVLGYNTAGQGNTVLKGDKEDPIRITEEKNSEPRFNLIVTVPTLSDCLNLCLAHTLCISGLFQNSSCDLRDEVHDTGIQQLPTKGVTLLDSINEEAKTFTVNTTSLTDMLGKCADRPCSNETFCLRSEGTGYKCLSMEKFLRRIKKRNVPLRKYHKAVRRSGRFRRSGTVRRSRLVRKKRSLSRPKRQLRVKKFKRSSKVDCGFPPELPRALSLYTTTHVGSKATYFCEEGVRTHDTESSIYCQANGKWTQPKFRCIARKTCKIPPKIPNARMHFSEVDGSETIKYECIPPPHMSAISACNPHDGTWHHIELDCSPKRQGNRSPLKEIPDTKKQTKNRNPAIPDPKKKSNKDNTARQNRAPKTLNENLNHPESENGIKSASRQKNMKHSRETKSSKNDATKTRVNVPKRHPNNPKTKSTLTNTKNSFKNKLKRSTPQNAPKSTKITTKTLKNNSKKTSSYVFLKSSTVPKETSLRLNKMSNERKLTITHKNQESLNYKNASIPTRRPLKAKLQDPKLNNKTPDSSNSSKSVSLSGKSAEKILTADEHGASNSSSEEPPVDDAANITNITHNDKTLEVAVKNSSNLDSKSMVSEKQHNSTSKNRDDIDHLDDVKVPTSFNESADNRKTISNQSLKRLYPNTFDQILKSKYSKELSHLGLRGVIRADVNARVGVPGFMCIHPGAITFATPDFHSTRIGSKASFSCNNYFFADPIAHCPVVTCLSDAIWSELFLSCSDLDCINPPTYYRGKRVCSSSGYKCRRWDEVLKDNTSLGTLHFPEKNISHAHNFCRDPFKQGTPWCFTEDVSVIWDYCTIPFCP